MTNKRPVCLLAHAIASSFILLGTSIALEGWNGNAFAEDCPAPVIPGCGVSVPVPCSNAKCAVIPPPGGTIEDYMVCNPGGDPVQVGTRYTATAAPNWESCVEQIGIGKCSYFKQPCANLYVYNSTSCTTATRCYDNAKIEKCFADTACK